MPSTVYQTRLPSAWLAYRQGRDHENCHDRQWRTHSTQLLLETGEITNITGSDLDNTRKGGARTGVLTLAIYSITVCTVEIKGRKWPKLSCWKSTIFSSKYLMKFTYSFKVLSPWSDNWPNYEQRVPSVLGSFFRLEDVEC